MAVKIENQEIILIHFSYCVSQNVKDAYRNKSDVDIPNISVSTFEIVAYTVERKRKSKYTGLKQDMNKRELERFGLSMKKKGQQGTVKMGEKFPCC